MVEDGAETETLSSVPLLVSVCSLRTRDLHALMNVLSV
jgi:hypothetical protein